VEREGRRAGRCPAGVVVCVALYIGLGAEGNCGRDYRRFGGQCLADGVAGSASDSPHKRHWYRAGENLKQVDRNWLRRLITRCEKPENFKQALEQQPDDIKVVVQFSDR
jgi:hypothetical protein